MSAIMIQENNIILQRNLPHTPNYTDTEWLVTDVCHQPIFEKIAIASRLSLAKTRKFCW